jgi:hypothetical protein
MQIVTRSRRAGAVAVLATVAGFLCAPVLAASADNSSGSGLSAVWAPEQLRFVYMGFTSKFSCDGLADRMKAVLLSLGARKDLHVTPSPCASPYGRPDPFPGVTVKMSVLKPADGSSGKADASNSGKADAAAEQPVHAHWQTVDLNAALGKDPLWQAGQCELLEQIKQSVLPKFTVRNVQYQSTCVPNQLSVGATQLRAEVLVPDDQGQASGQAPAASAPPAAPPARN